MMNGCCFLRYKHFVMTLKRIKIITLLSGANGFIYMNQLSKQMKGLNPLPFNIGSRDS